MKTTFRLLLGAATVALVLVLPAAARAEAPVLVTWQTGSGSFQAPLTDAQRGDIARVRQALATGQYLQPIGRLEQGTELNTGHSWHMIDVRLTPPDYAQPFLCNASVAHLESALTYYMTVVRRYCPVARPTAIEPLDLSAAFTLGNMPISLGSPTDVFPENKQNEPALAVDQAHPSIVAVGANDELDLQACERATCPFTPGVGISGIYFSTNGGKTYVQPTYSGLTARDCAADAPCSAHEGPIGTLPRFASEGLVTGGDPALAFGPEPDGEGGFSYAKGSRLYYGTLVGNLSGARDDEGFKGAEAVAVARLDTQKLPAALAGKDDAWLAPVVASGQNAAQLADKDALWADNAETSPHFGTVYACYTAFRGAGAGEAQPEPILLTRSTDGGDSWSPPLQLTQAANNAAVGGRQACAIRTDSRGTVYVYYAGFDKQSGSDAVFQTRSFDGGRHFEAPRVLGTIAECGRPDPVSDSLTTDGIAGARTSSFPSVDVANGAPSGRDATDQIVMTWCQGPTPLTSGAPSEQALVASSTDRGSSFRRVANAAAPFDRPAYPAIAIAPDGSDVWVDYLAFAQPWRADTSGYRQAVGVVRHADVSDGVVQPFTEADRADDLARGDSGDTRGSSTNDLRSEFLGDYDAAAATREAGIAAWTDTRSATYCPAVDDFRGGELATAPSPAQCPDSEGYQWFGNTDIAGGAYLSPEP